jgi:hypothetical protein
MVLLVRRHVQNQMHVKLCKCGMSCGVAEYSSLLRCDTVSLGQYLTTFRMIVLSSRLLDPEDKSTMFLRNVDDYSPVDSVQHPTKRKYSVHRLDGRVESLRRPHLTGLLTQ